MKRMIISAAVCLAVLASIAEEKAFLCVNVKESGQLEVALGDRINSVDSLVVTGGPLDYSDFKAIWRASWYGRLTSLNLENATVVDNKIPDFALYDVYEQYVKPPHTTYTPLHRIILPDNIKAIGRYAFARMELIDINIPQSLKSLDYGSFMSCHWLKKDKFVIPEGITIIPYVCFQHCQSIREFVLPSTLKTIFISAFENTRMEKINFPNGLERICQAAFQGSGELHEVFLPNSCQEIQLCAFSLCDSLKNLRLPEGLKVIPANLVSYSNALDSIHIPESVQEIKSDAFSMCTRLRKVNFPEGLERIETRAFTYCNLDSVILPSSVKEIGSDCFAGGIRGDVFIKTPIPPVCLHPNLPFMTYPEEGNTLYVPVGSGEAYRAAWGWSSFMNIVETDFAFMSGKDEMETDTRDGSIDITTSDGCIEINASGRRYGRYIISTMDGRIIAAGDIKQSKTTINVTQGLYVVSAANATRKVAVH